MAINPLRQVTSRAHVLDAPNIDTDIIFPARFLLVIERSGMGQHAFQDWRLNSDGSNRRDFPAPGLMKRDRHILIAGPNFGCGSSREHAVWSLADLGLRCIIAPSFGEIFYSNCFKSGLLPVQIEDISQWSSLRDAAEKDQTITVDLETQEVQAGNHAAIAFSVPAYRREALLNGLDDIDTVLSQDGDDIRTFEARRKAAVPWLFRPLS